MNAVPVKYVVISALFGMKYLVLDTSLEGQCREICRSYSLEDAHRIATTMNRAEGFEYPDYCKVPPPPPPVPGRKIDPNTGYCIGCRCWNDELDPCSYAHDEMNK